MIISKLFLCATVGIEADDKRIELFMSQVKGKDITELIAAGREKLASVPSGGACVAAAPGAAAGGAAPAAEAQKEEKVEEKEESDDVTFQSLELVYIEVSYILSILLSLPISSCYFVQDMGFSLFD